jgi:1-acyl-sn-glycerol-3-phosphate acyltransferase
VSDGALGWLRVQLFNIWLFAFSFVCAMAAWLAARFGSQAAVRSVVAWWTLRMVGAVRLLLGGTIEVLGRDNMPANGPVLLVAKHQSELDAILLFSLFPDMGAVVMQELERYPFFGTVLRRLDMIAVAVEQGPQGRTAQVVEGARRLMADGRPVLIYPEGTLMHLGARERYRRGAWRIQDATGATVVPIALSLGTIWPRRDWKKHVGQTGALAFLPAIAPGFDEATFMARIEEVIENGTMDLIRRHASGPFLAEAEERFASRAGIGGRAEGRAGEGA